MIPLVVPLLLAAGLTFQTQEIPGLFADANDRNWANPVAFFRRIDIDRDGLADLLTPTRVIFQRSGRFDTEGPLPIGPGAEAEADTWRSEVYLRHTDRLEVLRWEDGAWQETLVQPIRWPVSPNDSRPPKPERDEPGPILVINNRFLHDLNGDDEPEVVLPTSEGLSVYARSDTGFDNVANLKVFPQPRILLDSMKRAEPRDALASPSRGMACSALLDGNTLRVLEREAIPDAYVRYRLTNCRLEFEAGKITSETISESVTRRLPDTTEPCLLNADESVDFAYAVRADVGARALTLPLWEVGTSTDGGRTVQQAQAAWSRPAGRFVDVDGDGDRDRVLDRSGVFDGGLREMANRALTHTAVHHELLVHLQDERGRFADTPAFRWHGEIELGELPWKRGEMSRAYFDGDTINATGDYNADGRVDVLVRDRPDRLAVYLSSGHAYSSDPDATMPIPRHIRSIDTVDVDGDGRCDVLVLPAEDPDPAIGSSIGRTLVLFSRTASP